MVGDLNPGVCNGEEAVSITVNDGCSIRAAGGGRSKFHLDFWKSITHRKYILQCIRGAQIPFDSHPPYQNKPPPELHMSDDQNIFVDREIAKLLHNGSIKKLDSPYRVGWTSNIFLYQKEHQVNTV